MPIQIDPNSDKKPLLPEGRYGEQGEAELMGLHIQHPYNEEGFFLPMPVRVSHPEFGTIFVEFSGKDGKQPNTRLGVNQNSVVKTMVANIGLNADQLSWSDTPEDPEARVKRYPLLGADPCPLKVIVDVGVMTWKDRDTKEEKSRNYLKAIYARG